MKIIDIWINCPDDETARKIADALISARHVACANIFPEIQSSYHWKGRIENEPEVPLLVKTREGNFKKVVERLRELHPYETPAIIGVPVEFVNDDYLQWVYSETD
jgi:periplasmic divalent cation tolerance protein